MASLKDLRQRPSGYGGRKPWQVRYRDHTGKQRADQFTRKGDAETRLREVQTAEETGRLDVLDAGTATLAEVASQFFKLHKGEWKANTATGHAYVWNSVMEGEGKYPRPVLADMPVRNIRKSHVTEWRNDALAAGVALSTVRRVQSLIVRALDFAADDDIIPANPAARVKPPPKPRIAPARVIPPEQVEAIRSQMDERDARLVSILAYMGLRPHEARALRPEQFGDKELHLTEACAPDGSRQPLKAGHEMRDVPICKAVAADVAGVAGAWMFPNVHGEPWTKEDYDNWRDRRFKTAVKAANAKITADTDKANKRRKTKAEPVLIPDDLTPYDLRHTFVSLCYRQGIDKATIAAWAGHSVEVMEGYYAHHFKTLGALDRRTTDQLIAAARHKR